MRIITPQWDYEFDQPVRAWIEGFEYISLGSVQYVRFPDSKKSGTVFPYVAVLKDGSGTYGYASEIFTWRRSVNYHAMYQMPLPKIVGFGFQFDCELFEILGGLTTFRINPENIYEIDGRLAEKLPEKQIIRYFRREKEYWVYDWATRY